ncbi:formin-like protein 5 [Ananas comosus]|uniref:Formin-like protein 5 n=1 Tax=Ananas comosus TaxID=4615 RepID=A0A6P5EMS1_ANACO|nr:formin-like protein 5 [Ananas comosus]
MVLQEVSTPSSNPPTKGRLRGLRTHDLPRRLPSRGQPNLQAPPRPLAAHPHLCSRPPPSPPHDPISASPLCDTISTSPRAPRAPSRGGGGGGVAPSLQSPSPPPAGTDLCRRHPHPPHPSSTDLFPTSLQPTPLPPSLSAKISPPFNMETGNSLESDNQLEFMPAEGASKIGSTSTYFGTDNTQITIDTFDNENEIQWSHEPEIGDFDGENEILYDNELAIEDEPTINEPYIGLEFGSADEQDSTIELPNKLQQDSTVMD